MAAFRRNQGEPTTAHTHWSGSLMNEGSAAHVAGRSPKSVATSRDN
jgi:hypothetical protein